MVSQCRGGIALSQQKVNNRRSIHRYLSKLIKRLETMVPLLFSGARSPTNAIDLFVFEPRQAALVPEEWVSAPQTVSDSRAKMEVAP